MITSLLSVRHEMLLDEATEDPAFDGRGAVRQPAQARPMGLRNSTGEDKREIKIGVRRRKPSQELPDQEQAE